MKQIVHKWGADYLVTDEPVNPAPVTLTSPEGITLEPGRQVKQIGNRRRNIFELKAPHYMIYEGVMRVDGLDYAIFHCPAHDATQLDIFASPIRYRYAFTIVWVNKQFNCFLVGPGGPHGCRDLRLDYLA